MEFGNNGTDGYYKRILAKVMTAIAATPTIPAGHRIVADENGLAFVDGIGWVVCDEAACIQGFCGVRRLHGKDRRRSL